MKTNRYIIIFLNLFIYSTSVGQDTIVYRQANALMFSNEYYFIKNNIHANYGTFYQRISTDDMQYWHGAGSFVETKKKILLTYSKAKEYNRVTQLKRL